MKAADAVVVGAGPAGIAAVSQLVARRLRVHWIDRAFRSGAMARYSAVPANTKLDVLLPGLALFLPPDNDGQWMAQERRVAAERSLEAMRAAATHQPFNSDPSPLGWTTLGAVADYFDTVTSLLLNDPRVSCCTARVTSLVRQHGTSAAFDRGWAVHVCEQTGSLPIAHSPSVVLATGGTPCAAPAAVQPSAWASEDGGAAPRVLSAEAALDPQRLRELVRPHETVAIVGGGHSAFVVAMHLVKQRVRTRLFIRRPVRLAQWDAHGDAYGAWAFRGLKGAAAEFALRRVSQTLRRSHVHTPAPTFPHPRSCSPSRPPRYGLADAPPLNGRVGATSLSVFDAALLNTSRELASVDAVVFCVGYEPARTPHVLDTSGVLPTPADAVQLAGHRAPHGELLSSNGSVLDGMYGLGLGFADDEFSSGEAYGEVGFVPFLVRAAEIAEHITSRGAVWPLEC